MTRPKVTVYIASYNYGQYLEEAVESVISQLMNDWELFIVDDGSEDNTAEICESYAEKHANIYFLRHLEPAGLRACANEVIELARGDYVIRLDADDYFDESALLVLSAYLDKNPDVGLVYPNWVYVDEAGRFLGIENRKKIGSESRVLDLPAHGACTMVRKRVLKTIGGYDTGFDAQDGHELWLKVLHRFKVANISTPLFFYRQHESSMSRDEKKMLNTRQKIKRGIARKQEGEIKPRVAVVIPAKNTYEAMPNIALTPVAGKPLIGYTVQSALESELVDDVFVFSDDQCVVDYCTATWGISGELRPMELSSTGTRLAEVLVSAVDRLEKEHEYFADIVVLLSIHSPLRTASHITKAIDTLQLYNVDNVISTYEDLDLHFVHDAKGMKPLNPGIIDKLRFERESLFVDNGAIHAIWREFIDGTGLYKGNVGHIVMSRSESLQVKSKEDLKLIELVLSSEEKSPAGF